MAGNKTCHKPDLFTVGLIFVIGVLCIAGTAFVSIGAFYLHDCEVERHIPIYVLVQGVVLLLAGVIVLILFTRDKFILFFLLLCIPCTFWFCWLIIGSVWVFPHYTTYHGQCNDVLYLFAFWTLIVQYIGLSIAFLSTIIYGCFICIMLWACMGVNG
ncbi:transmembrane protein 272-like [Spea bombifrons]|uniref:transmembrane protein 272-like n=1 Tax=Spea bombifrons TaxID=233779 RepID=UPI00234B5BE8|nr:transmembrane protein 272-like [Spea bombifrons]